MGDNMSRKGATLPIGSDDKITIICSEEQEKYIRECGCIACDDDICDCAFCSQCTYDADNIEFKRPETTKKLEELCQDDTVLVKAKVNAVFTGSKMVCVETRDAEKGFDAYTDEVASVNNDEENFIVL